MKPVIVISVAALAAVIVWAVIVFNTPPPMFDRPGNGPVSLSPQEVRVLGMARLQDAMEDEMRLFVREGRFSDDLSELGSAAQFEKSSGIVRDRAAVEVCENETVVVLGTEAVDGSVFAVKARGVEPHDDGEAVFSHYTEDPSCDPSSGPKSWPGGYEVSRQGLLKGGKPADIPLE